MRDPTKGSSKKTVRKVSLTALVETVGPCSSSPLYLTAHRSRVCDRLLSLCSALCRSCRWSFPVSKPGSTSEYSRVWSSGIIRGTRKRGTGTGEARAGAGRTYVWFLRTRFSGEFFFLGGYIDDASPSESDEQSARAMVW